MLIQELKAKHDRLKKKDGGRFFKKPTYKIFGSDSHQYKFNPCLSINALRDFEKSFSITFPLAYSEFITQIGNGGSGPAYGLLPLSGWEIELDINDPGFLRTPFPHTENWNLPQLFNTAEEDYTESKEFQQWEAEYFSNMHITGSIRICHYGCAIYYLLVVTGKETGYIWIDDRASDQGIYPAISKFTGKRLTFESWFDEWLTESLAEFS